MTKQAIMQSKRTTPIYMFGVRVPRNEKEARMLDEEYVKLGLPPKWRLSEESEINSLSEYETFRNYGSRGAPPGYRFIKVFFVYAVCSMHCSKRQQTSGRTKDRSRTHEWK